MCKNTISNTVVYAIPIATTFVKHVSVSINQSFPSSCKLIARKAPLFEAFAKHPMPFDSVVLDVDSLVLVRSCQYRGVL